MEQEQQVNVRMSNEELENYFANKRKEMINANPLDYVENWGRGY
jgi:hypothetical protein